MVDLWMLRMNLLPRHSGCTIERHDGCDVDRYLRILIRQWYADALANAYPDYLPQADMVANSIMRCRRSWWLQLRSPIQWCARWRGVSILGICR